MEKLELFGKFYLDTEKDIIINLYQQTQDELDYIIETPNHHTGNLITNLAKICNVEIVKDENDMKIIKGKIEAYINGENKLVYIFRLNGIKIANIYEDGTIDQKVILPAMNKTFMSQTKNYDLPIEKTLTKLYIPKKIKFRTDLHTHIHANLSSDNLIALGIKHQIKYPLYYIKKLGLKLTQNQYINIMKQREIIEKNYLHSELAGKKLIRKIDDETYINFADLILNNEENMKENIDKIRNSLVLMKDGQAVFTNLEKLYLYRYVFSKGKISEEHIKIDEDKVNKIPEKDIKQTLLQMLEDSKKEEYANNTLLQDKLLWVAREYQKQGIEYAEISVTWIVSKGLQGATILKELHEILPKIEKETKVKLRFLGSLSRTLMTSTQLVEGVEVIKAAAKSPYIVGSDIIGEEINDIRNFKSIIKELVEFAIKEDNGFTVRIHAGENDAYRENVKRAIECVKDAVPKGEKMPRCRIGHGLYGIDLNTEDGKKLLKEMRDLGIILEFQLTSNVRLNNLNKIENHPIKQYLNNNVKCVQGTDGHGFYGTNCMEEQIALQNALDLSEEQLMFMRNTEIELTKKNDEYFEKKQKEFEKWLNGRDIIDAIIEQEEENIKNSKEIKLLNKNKLESKEVFKEKIVKLPEDKLPVIIAGGSFNSDGRETKLTEEGKKILRELITKLNSEKAYFVIGHKMQGYEKAIVDISKEMNKKFEINAIVPKKVSEEIKNTLLDNDVNGVCISTESEELGIYKSFNYEIFERRNSVVVAFDGNSPVSNLVQEAKNGKGKAKIYVNSNVDVLKQKAESLEGYVIPFNNLESITDSILKEHPEIANENNKVV